MLPLNDICAEFATILGGTPKLNKEEGTCSISLTRKDLSVTLWGIPTNLPLATSFSFQTLPCESRTLNLGDIILLQEEVPCALEILSQEGITASAMHNHWLLDEPHLMYVHVQAIMDPLKFAKVIAQFFGR